ncbi:MAG: MotA/TolQ/ExbB proton channel family protein [Desulfobulbaceae bacterium]|nr:MotA/TolQ/ExbB proton channel family protein [Desulfobulbaceae bacterium]MCK5436647.1 MotA/TolQ/ExbB proton channel family protein [Desulfobulbaceae bacterium]
MEITALLKSFIYLLASSLFLPVLALLAGLAVWLIIYSGSFFGLWLERSRLKKWDGTDLPGDLQAKSAGLSLSSRVEKFLERLDGVSGGDLQEVQVMNLLRETELHLWKSLDSLKILIRIGPGLGLIGTLIPMGTGLASLGQGDLTRLSGDLVIAFTTTVVGMALGLAAYFFFTIQRRWVEEDIKNMELAAEVLAGDWCGINKSLNERKK